MRPESLVATLRKRAELARAASHARAEAVLSWLVSEIPALTPPGARVWLIGSLVWGGFGERSDVDLVVAGFTSDAALALERKVVAGAGVPVEILDLSELDSSFRARVETEGRLLA